MKLSAGKGGENIDDESKSDIKNLLVLVLSFEKQNPFNTPVLNLFMENNLDNYTREL